MEYISQYNSNILVSSYAVFYSICFQELLSAVSEILINQISSLYKIYIKQGEI